MKCGNCNKTDGLCYTSLPPKVKCTVTGNFHNYDDDCDVGKIVLEPIAPALATHCIVCNGVIELTGIERLRLERGFSIESKVCDKCKAAILHIREQMENQNGTP